MTSICLVHGAYHGPGCWGLLAPLLATDHDVITVDLPNEDPSVGAAGYARVVLEAIEGRGEDVVLIGHSLAGVVIPLVAQQHAVRRLIFLCSLLPLPGKSLRQQLQEEPIGTPGYAESGWIEHEDGTYSWEPEAAIELFYQDCSRKDAAWALAHMRRQGVVPVEEVTPLLEWPDVACSYLMCDEDRVLNPEWARTAVKERLGIDPIELPGGHSPFVSRPKLLAEALAPLLDE